MDSRADIVKEAPEPHHSIDKPTDTEADRTRYDGPPDNDRPLVVDQFDRNIRRFAQLLVLAAAFCFGAVFIMGAIGTIATQSWIAPCKQVSEPGDAGLMRKAPTGWSGESSII